MTRQIYIASDHAGFGLKQALIGWLSAQDDLDIHDLGTNGEDSVDYPDFGYKLALALKDNDDPRKAMGIAICGTGIGISIACNRHKHIRAALCQSAEDASLARGHNNANILALGARILDVTTAQQIVNAFLQGEFEGGRHQRRVDKLTNPAG